MKYFENVSELFSQNVQNCQLTSDTISVDIVIVGGGPAGIATLTCIADLQKIQDNITDSDLSSSRMQLIKQLHAITKEREANNPKFSQSSRESVGTGNINNNASVPLSVLLVDAGKDFYERSHQSPQEVVLEELGYLVMESLASGNYTVTSKQCRPSGSVLYQLKDTPSLEVAYNRIAHYLSSIEENKEVEIPAFPNHLYSSENEKLEEETTKKWFQKKYPSMYLDLSQRRKLIENMLSRCENSSSSKIRDICCSSANNADIEYTTSLTSLNTMEAEKPTVFKVKSRYLVLATGKYGPLLMKNYKIFQTQSTNTSTSNTPVTDHRSKYKYRRVEIGFRIVQPSIYSFFSDSISNSQSHVKCIDPKFQFKDFISLNQLSSSPSQIILPKEALQESSQLNSFNIEWRTFCACKEGEVAVCLTQGIWSVSGRSDCPPTSSNNIGLNTRILDEELFLDIVERSRGTYFASITSKESTQSSNSNKNQCFEFPLVDLLPLLSDPDPTHKAIESSKIEAERQLINCYGADFSSLMLLGLTRLINYFPGIVSSAVEFPSETKIVGPQIEGNTTYSTHLQGVGYYPDTSVESNLLLHMDSAFSNCWVAGDCTGLFRGTVASLVSGYFIGMQIFRCKNERVSRIPQKFD